MGYSPSAVVKEIQRQGWQVVRRTRHGILFERRGERRQISYANHPKPGQLGAAQLRMLSKTFQLDPPLIVDAPQSKEVEVPSKTMVGMKKSDWAPRVSTAMKNLEMPDSKLATLMGRSEQWVRDIKRGKIIPTEEEQSALFGVFGITKYKALATKWFQPGGERVSSPPPLRRAPWVLNPTNGSSNKEARQDTISDALGAVEEKVEEQEQEPETKAEVEQVSVAPREPDYVSQPAYQEPEPESEVNPKEALIVQVADAIIEGRALQADERAEMEQVVDTLLKPVREMLIAYMADNLRLTVELKRVQAELEAKTELESALELMEETLARYRKHA